MGIVCCVLKAPATPSRDFELDVDVDSADVFERSLYSEGVSIGDFRLERLIGVGCFGRTALVTYKASGRLYAMKAIQKAEVYRPHLKLRSKRERQEIASRENPFVVVVDFGFQDPNHLFVVSQFQPGGDLGSRLRRVGQMSEAEVRFYIAEIALSLAWFHDKQIIYRNLKPRSILLDAEGHVRLSELSVCLEQENLRDSQVCGDPNYTAPEVFKGFRYENVADFWSLV